MDQLQDTVTEKEKEVVETQDDSCSIEQLKSKLEALTAPEEKIGHLLIFMEQTISRGATPSFKEFWEVRKLCLGYFKEENLAFGVRAHLWNKYVEVSKEAYRLKEILDEQSAFAVEQIELAVKALESDISSEPSDGQADKFSFDPMPRTLSPNYAAYKSTQAELTRLNAFAARINSMRKELIKTEMRIRNKNQFFKRLSSAGDAVFPRRKELIKIVSTQFISDVRGFIEASFKSEEFNQPLFALREEIKSLQGAAKELTLNTQAFNQSRMELSECWDVIKRFEKDVKKEKAKERAELSGNATPFYEALKELVAARTEQTIEDGPSLQKLEVISNEMRGVKLSRDDVKKLRAKLNEIRFEIQNKQETAHRERVELERQEKLKQRELFQSQLASIEELAAKLNTSSIEDVEEEAQSIKASALELNPTKWEIQDLERRMRTLKDHISHAKIQNLPDDARKALEQLQSLMKDAAERRKEIRAQLESFRKNANISGFDLEQALQQRELVESEKERLRIVDGEIEQIQQKISNLSV